MPIRTYVSSAWQDIEDLKSTVNGASETSEDARIEVDGAWESVWGDDPKITFGWVYSTGVGTPQYTYTPSQDGISATYKAIVSSTTSRTDLVLKVKPPATTKSSYTLSFKTSNVTATCASDSYTIAVGYIDSNGDIHTIQSGAFNKSITINNTLDIKFISICIQAYGSAGQYHAGTISNVIADGIQCYFE